MAVSHIFLKANWAPSFDQNHVLSTQRNADYAWRIVLMLGALPALLTYYWRMKMPYTAIIEGNAKQAASDMGRRHGRHLIGTMSTWFLLDIAFYSQNLTQKDIFPVMGLTKKARQVNALEEMFEISRAMFVIAMFGTFPGYWFTVAFIEKLGRFNIQLMGFFKMSVFMFIIGIKYEDLATRDNRWLFSALYGLTFFFANFRPNSTTFVLPAELFPTRVRSTCHAMSAAAGKAGAMVGAFGIQTYTLHGEKSKIKKEMIILAVTNMLGFFCTFLVTETKGRSLEEISGEDGSKDKAEAQMSNRGSRQSQES
ncbi:General substrate transporter [Cynara cardunculus var. scolymus]|uniref:General substrate transporter n=1 Tax=Cynara cardunculus var. scolymus TaxID=59895 RepID=A0A118K2N6_CYNCS|nr:General substrate transporter [Cynara cardunculus var. scolymus]